MASLIGRTSLHFLTRRTLLNSVARFLPLVQFKLSDIGEGIAEVQIKEWHVKEGDRVAQFDNICEVQSDKASVTITSRYDGIIKKLYYNVDDLAKVGSTLVDIEVDEERIEKADEHAAVENDERCKPEKVNVVETIETGNANARGHVLATPAVRRFAMERGVNLNEVTGTGHDRRILKDDVIRFDKQKRDSAKAPNTETAVGGAPSQSAKAASPPSPQIPKKFEPLKADEVIPIRGYTRAMIKSMTESLKIPHLGYCDEVIVDRLITMRRELKKFESTCGARMSFMPLIIKAVSLALIRYPRLNSVTDENLKNIICKASHNISIAMDTAEGLVVPNIKNCEQRTVWEIAAELNRLQEASGQMQILPEDLTGGTFTISNVGMIGGTYLSPVIMPPQLAIGAIGQISKLPRFDKDGNVYAANVMKFSWAADHRVVDGATLARFGSLVKRYLENPSSMVADLR